ncbi:M20 family peptidase [Pseudoduganella aquatica]|uniref:M20 family peptidase n=1 Tax=Pseudoduganella aquatica TaxID=2660641 RepID=UPI001E31B2E0|nr:M20 family peptidase [Pseudoduganella aquatica]
MRNKLKLLWAVLAGVAVLLLLLIMAMLVNVLRVPSLPPVGKVTAAAPADLAAASERLAAAVRIATVSGGEGSEGGEAAVNRFPELHRLLETSFPRTHAQLRREVVDGSSLLYTWQGSDPSLQPVLLTAHMDVVPVEPGTEDKWRHAPFAGDIADGYVWGRGTLDMKHAVMATFEGVEHLLAAGFRPKRTILLAFGHDEELGGHHGAARIADLLEQRKVRARFSLDEGSLIVDGLVPGMARPVAPIGLSEKGYVSLQLTATAAGGHSSMPPPYTAVGRVSRAVARLEEQPMAASLDGPGGAGLLALAPALPFSMRAGLANSWLLEPVLVRQLAASNTTNAMIRTTTAPTMISGGVKDNVLPADAKAVVNFRLAPGDTVAKVQAHVVRAIADPLVKVAVDGATAAEASPVADRNGPGYQLISAALAAVAPEALVTPGLVVAGTDSRHYSRVSDAAYRFLPVRMKPSDIARIHGTDERISIANYGELIAFYQSLMRLSAE